MSIAIQPKAHDDILRARAITDALFAQVHPEALYDRPIPERHRLLFYLGHIEAFDWNYIGRNIFNRRPVSEELDELFAFGIDPAPGQLPQDEPRDWPSLDRTIRYVGDVRKHLDEQTLIAPENAFHVLLEHRLMHAETITYLLHNLAFDRRLTKPAELLKSIKPIATFIQVPSGRATLGLNRNEGFGWDNEFARHTRDVPAFRISKYKVTNAEYLEFVRAGGPTPHYWIERPGGWMYRGFHAEVALPQNFPVYASYLQAKALRNPHWKSNCHGDVQSSFTFTFPLIVGAGALLVAPRICARAGGPGERRLPHARG